MGLGDCRVFQITSWTAARSDEIRIFHSLEHSFGAMVMPTLLSCPITVPPWSGHCLLCPLAWRFVQSTDSLMAFVQVQLNSCHLLITYCPSHHFLFFHIVTV